MARLAEESSEYTSKKGKITKEIHDDTQNSHEKQHDRQPEDKDPMSFLKGNDAVNIHKLVKNSTSEKSELTYLQDAKFKKESVEFELDP